jgi:hypothetical protein
VSACDNLSAYDLDFSKIEVDLCCVFGISQCYACSLWCGDILLNNQQLWLRRLMTFSEKNKACVQLAVAFAGTDPAELPDSLRKALDEGLMRNDLVTDMDLRPVIFDEVDRQRDGQQSGLIFGIPLGTTPDDMQARAPLSLLILCIVSL